MRRAIEEAPVLVTAGVVLTDMVSGFFGQHHIDPARAVDVGAQQSTVGDTGVRAVGDGSRPRSADVDSRSP